MGYGCSSCRYYRLSEDGKTKLCISIQPTIIEDSEYGTECLGYEPWEIYDGNEDEE